MYVYPTSEEYLTEFYRSFAFAKHEMIFAKILIQILRSNFTKKRFESLIVIRSIVSSFPKNLRESFYRLKATKIFFQSLLIIGPFRLVYHPICTIGRRYIMIISHLSSLNRINVNTSTRITEPVSARDDVSVASAEGLTGIILCAGYRREHSPPFGHHDARNVLDDRCGRDRRQLVMRRSRLSARRWLRSPPICRFSDPDRVLCDPFSSPFSFFSAPCRSAAPSTWVSLNF